MHSPHWSWSLGRMKMPNQREIDEAITLINDCLAKNALYDSPESTDLLLQALEYLGHINEDTIS